MIDRDHALPLSHQAELLDLSRSGLYYEPVAMSKTDQQLMREIDRLHTEYPFAGARMLRGMLRKRGYDVLGRRHVGRLMRLMGIEALYRKKKSTTRNPEHPVYPYLLRGLEIDRPNQVWAADITYIPMRQGFLYLFVILDWATRRVLEWRLSNSLTTDFCIDGLESAIARFGCPQIFNTDQGCQFTDRAFVGTLKTRGNRDQYGWTRRLARQRVRGTLLAVDQVRGGLSARVRVRQRGQGLHWALYHVLQRVSSALEPRRPHARRGILQPAAGSGGVNAEVIT
jgi:putative transposase